ncbi:phosphoribosyl-ATP pyrophosphohydrolase [candidate division WS5 bacterium]|uniref:Phosphoribosyl-ATP pyrophosphohydrolase n=1 Tax=candidate division WS5 bacterium TaxID=2093353 RepID=A0A419DG12_9BACT|nr:MAG: phosphoribosyl-ATP pyrophosphohydrolase [candidate division WS5 bacterium]
MGETSESKEYPDEAVYKKLVRDRIPEIIEADGLVAETRTLEREEYLELLKKKLIEEAQEVAEASDRNETGKELSDVLEVVRSIAETEEISMEEVMRIMEERAEKRGRFQNKTYLERTWRES